MILSIDYIRLLLLIAATYGTAIDGGIVENELQNFFELASKSIIFSEDYDMLAVDKVLETVSAARSRLLYVISAKSLALI